MNLREEEVLKFGPEALDLLKKMLIIDPKERITTFQALDHPFFMKDKDNDSVSTAWSIKLTIDNIIEMEMNSKQIQSLLQENQQLRSTIDQQKK